MCKDAGNESCTGTRLGPGAGHRGLYLATNKQSGGSREETWGRAGQLSHRNCDEEVYGALANAHVAAATLRGYT